MTSTDVAGNFLWRKYRTRWSFDKLIRRVVVVHVLLICMIVVPASAAIPEFAVEPTDTVVREGQMARFSCAATGTPTPQVVGYAKDGTPVSLDTAEYFLESSGSLRIPSTTRSMDGYYQCTAGNSDGSLLSKRAKLTIAYFDRVSLISESKSAAPNTYIIFSGPTVIARPDPKFEWRKDGTLLAQSDRITIGSDGSLYIANVERTDAGRYVLNVVVSFLTSAGDAYGNQEVKSVTLTVTDIPQSSIPTIMRGPQNTLALQGSSSRAVFECFVSGIKDPTSLRSSVTWKKDGQTISASSKYGIGDYGKTLSILSPVRQDEGFYTCEVNYNGVTRMQGKLDVVVPATFTGIQPDVTAYTDNSTTLYCNYTAYPGAVPRWYLNGHQVIRSSRVMITAIQSLYIPVLQWSDAGIYQCLVENAAGLLIGTSLVKVQNITVKIIRKPEDVYVPIGTTIILPCDVVGAPKPKITWLRDRQQIPDNLPQFSQRANGYLQITQARSEESGSYTCLAENDLGKDEATVTVNFLSETTIIEKPEATTSVVKGLDIELPCKVKHDPRITISREWRKNGELVSDVRYTVLETGALQIKSAQKADSATFKCLIFSKAGNDSATTKLEFVERPFQPFTPTISEIQARSLRLSWYPGYDGGSPILYYLIEYKNGTEDWELRSKTSGPTPTTVVITELMPGRKYTFRLKAKNNFSTSSPSSPTEEIQTLMLAPSEAPGNFEAVGYSTSALKLTWTVPPPHTHNGALLGYIIFYRLEGYENSEFTKITVSGGDTTSYIMSSLPEFTRYAVKMAAYNAAGTGAESKVLLAETKEGIPEGPPQNLSVSVVNSSAVRVSFDAPPQRLWNGFLRFIKGYAWKPERPQDQTTFVAKYDATSPVRQSFIFLGLQPNTEYSLAVSVMTNSGESPKSDILLFKTQEGVPDAPQDLFISGIFADAFTVSWNPPSQIAGTLLGYYVRYRLFGDSVFFNITEPAHSKGAVVRGLNPLTRYEVFVQAFTIAGTSESVSRTVTTTDKPTLPGPPTGLKHYEIKPRSIALGWTPGDSGRAVILHYLIEYNNDTDFRTSTQEPIWLLALNLTRILDNPVTIPNLRPNSVYRFRMKAFNSVGASPYSNISEDIRTAEGAPSEAPRYLNARPQGRQTLLIEWLPPPQDTWNSDSIRYDISLEPLEKPFGVTTRIRYPDSSARSYLARGLDRWMLYNITVAVFNSMGYGPSSESIRARTSEDVPDVGPDNVVATAIDNKRVNVSWGEIPSGLANGIVLGYRVVYQLQGQPQTALNQTFPGNTTHSGILLGLDGYAFYEISVLGYTTTGDGKPSLPVTLKTLEGVPGKPQRVRFPVVTLDMVRVTWGVPLKPNGIILSYDVRYKERDSSGQWLTVYQERTGPNVLSADARGLKGNVYYVFNIRGRTRIGFGEEAVELVITTEKREVPESPIVLRISDSAVFGRHVIVKWVPRNDGKSPIRSYSLQINVELEGWKNYKDDLPADIEELKVEGLHPVRSYRFRVKATNDVGDSPWSEPSNAVITSQEIPTGAPTEVIIIGDSATSLSVEWKAPSTEDLNGNLVNFRIKYKQQGAAGDYTVKLLPPTVTSYSITNLEIFTAYEIALAALNEKGTGPWTPTFVRRTGESAPTEAPTDVVAVTDSASSVRLRWKPPPAYTINGYLQGYKIEYLLLGDANSRRRKRRSLSDSCPTTEPPLQTKLVPPNTNEELLRNLRKFSAYTITIRAYNSAGDGPRSAQVRTSTTEDVPGPPVVTFSRGYSDLVVITWNPPCDPNGIIVEYQLQFEQTGGQRFPELKYPARQRSAEIVNLESLRQYKFSLSARTSVGYGKVFLLTLYTRGAPRPPGPPGTPHIVSRDSGFVMDWTEGDDGNVPILRYDIEGRNSVSEGWRLIKTISASSASRNSTVLSYVLTGLKPEATYMFRLIAINRVGASQPSPASIALKAGGRSASKPVYEEIWFIIMLVCIFLVIVTLVIVVVCLRRRSRSGKYGSPRRVLHMENHWVSKGPWVDNAPDIYDKAVEAKIETRTRSGNKVEKTENRQGYGFSSFEMAMVRRQDSSQRLIREENAGNGTVSSQASKKSKTLDRVISPKSDAKPNLDEVSVSSVSKHSDVSENDADKSADETEEEKRHRRNREAESSIASHYSNDPFHKSWRNSMDKKTRKAILAEYNKRREAGASMDSLDDKVLARSASEEQLDRPRGRPGRPDQSEKKKRTRSEPFLAEQGDDTGVSSFVPGKATGQTEIRRPGKKGIDRTVARSDPYLARVPSDSDSDQRYPAPPSYENSSVPGRPKRRKNSFLRATHGANEGNVEEEGSTSDTPRKSKREMAEELDRALDYYQRPPPPYESEFNGYDSDVRPPPAYTPTNRDRQRRPDLTDNVRSPYSVDTPNNEDSRYSTDSQLRNGYSDSDRNPRYNSDRRSTTDPPSSDEVDAGRARSARPYKPTRAQKEYRSDYNDFAEPRTVPNRHSDHFEDPNRSMTLV